MRRTMAIVAMMVAITAASFAYGGGGFFEGSFVPIAGYSNIGRDAEVAGGYGYGANRSGMRYGGFGLVVHDTTTEEVIGAYGGFISGSQLRVGPVTLSLNLWSGVGYVDPRVVSASRGFGFLVEGDAEAGLAILPWFQLGLYAGMQAIGSFGPGSVVSGVRYTPVVGTRFTWGWF